MRPLSLFTIIVSFIIFLTGCQSDEKQLAKILNIIEESTVYEKRFHSNLTDLEEMRKNAQLVYLDLINLNINDKNLITQKIKEANTYKKKQEKWLAEAEENFQEAYETSAAMETPIKKISNEDQMNQASELFVMLNERKRLIDSFFEAYHKNLELQNSFYQQLEKGAFTLENLDKQIHAINKSNQDMEEMIQQYNQYTEKYIEMVPSQ